jgi:hypothetical protein
MLRWFSAYANALLIGTLLCGSVAAEVNVAPSGKGYDIDVSGQASTTEVIDAIAAATGATIQGYPEGGTVADNRIRGASLERALRALLPKAAFVVRFNADDTPAAIIFLSDAKDSAPQGADPDADEGLDAIDETAPPMEDFQ